MKRKLSSVLAIAIAVCTFVPSFGTAAEASVTAAASKKTKITMLNNVYGPEAPKADLEVFKRIGELTGVDLDITWVPFSAYNEKYNAMLAASDLPEVVLCNEPKSGAMVNAVRSGLFWEIGDYISQYDNLSELSPVVFDALSIDGGVYSLFRQRVLARGGYIIRKDWLNNLGLEMPKTIAEVYEVAEAFTKKDPDGNGKDDTFGLAENKATQIREIGVWLGGATAWYIENETAYPDFMHPAYKDSLDFYKNLYDNGYINKDFPVVENRQDNINNGKAGIFFGVVDNVNNMFSDLFKLFPEAELDIYMALETPDGRPTVRASNGYLGVFYFPKTSIKTEDALLERLAFLDKLGDPEICDLINWGIEGENYFVNNGKVFRTEKQKSDYSVVQNDIMQISPFGTLRKNMTEAEVTPLQAKVDKFFVENIGIVTPNPCAPYVSETEIQMGKDLQNIWSDAQIKYVLGEIDSAGWQKAIDDWKKAGGQKVIDEFTEQYNKFHN